MGENMEEVYNFLKDSKTFYLATMEGDQPRVRPMGFIMLDEGRIYFSTDNTKPMYRQMSANSKIEICAMAGGSWMRLSGRVVLDTSEETLAKALEVSPMIKNMIPQGEGKKGVFFYFEKGSKAVIENFQGEKKEILL
jgi:uncharacterized pyridoxamine 5'-phosphate oxidase family protein